MRQPSFTILARHSRPSSTRAEHTQCMRMLMDMPLEPCAMRINQFDARLWMRERARMLASQRRRYAAPERKVTGREKPSTTAPVLSLEHPRPSIIISSDSTKDMHALNHGTNHPKKKAHTTHPKRRPLRRLLSRILPCFPAVAPFPNRSPRHQCNHVCMRRMPLYCVQPPATCSEADAGPTFRRPELCTPPRSRRRHIVHCLH